MSIRDDRYRYNTCASCGMSVSVHAVHHIAECALARRMRGLRERGWVGATDYFAVRDLAAAFNLPCLIVCVSWADPSMLSAMVPVWVAAVWNARAELGPNLMKFALREGRRDHDIALAYATIWEAAPRAVEIVGSYTPDYNPRDPHALAVHRVSKDRRRFALADYVMTLTKTPPITSEDDHVYRP